MRIAAAAALTLAFTAVVADAKITGTPAGLVVRYPSGQVPDPTALQLAMSSPQVSTIVFEKGTQLFSDSLFVFKRNDLTLCGATGNPKDVVVQSSAGNVFYVEQAERITFRGLTIDASTNGAVGVRVVAVPDPTIESFAGDVSVERCRIAAFIGVQASVRARDLSVADSSFRIRGGGAGVLWEDGAGLSVTRSRFTVDPGPPATAGVFIRGAQTATSEGDRATRVLLTNNRMEGDLATGFDLADVNGALVRGNHVQFGSSTFGAGQGRVGIVVRRAAASQLTEDYDVARNVVRRAHYGVWLLNVGDGRLSSNDLKTCGSPQPDTRFGDQGAAVRINVGGLCNTTLTSNDFRQLRSPKSVAAVVMSPRVELCEAAGNRVDPGRPEFGETNP